MGVEIMVAAALISGGVSAYGQYQAGKQQARIANFNAAIAENNAVAAKQWASYNEDRYREQAKFQRARMISAYLKNGVSLEAGTTPMLVLEEQLVQDELEALSIRRGGEGEAGRYRSSAAMSRLEGSAAQTASYYGAGSTLLTSAFSAAETSQKYGTTKPTTKGTLQV